jgi:hypothetical protein
VEPPSPRGVGSTALPPLTSTNVTDLDAVMLIHFHLAMEVSSGDIRQELPPVATHARGKGPINLGLAIPSPEPSSNMTD